MQFPVITYGMALYINELCIPTKNTNIEKIYVYICERAEVSELRKFSRIFFFYILKLLFLSIFCWYFRYFVGTNDMLVGLHVATNFEMYRQNSEKASFFGGWGGIAPLPSPPPPPGYKQKHKINLSQVFWIDFKAFKNRIGPLPKCICIACTFPHSQSKSTEYNGGDNLFFQHTNLMFLMTKPTALLFKIKSIW